MAYATKIQPRLNHCKLYPYHLDIRPRFAEMGYSIRYTIQHRKAQQKYEKTLSARRVRQKKNARYRKKIGWGSYLVKWRNKCDGKEYTLQHSSHAVVRQLTLFEIYGDEKTDNTLKKSENVQYYFQWSIES